MLLVHTHTHKPKHTRGSSFLGYGGGAGAYPLGGPVQVADIISYYVIHIYIYMIM